MSVFTMKISILMSYIAYLARVARLYVAGSEYFGYALTAIFVIVTTVILRSFSAFIKSDAFDRFLSRILTAYYNLTEDRRIG